MYAAIVSAFCPVAVRLLVQYHECTATRLWARLVLKIRGGNQRFRFSCTSPLHAHEQGSKRLANAQRRERQKHLREAWVAGGLGSQD
jgi:hypothetical protein